MKQVLLPYYNERPENKIDALVIHCSSESAEGMLKVLQKAQLSCHYIVGLDGEIIQVVPEEKRAWHAGVSSWRGMDNLNHNSIGIELSSPTMGQSKYADKQIESLLTLCLDIIKRYNIPAENIVGHSDIAPERKPDPGVCFPWQYFAQNGVGLWYDEAENVSAIKENNVEKLLSEIGYNVSCKEAAVYAFCRHFVPQKIKINPNIKELVQQPFDKVDYKDENFMSILKKCWIVYNKNIDKKQD